RYEPFGLAVLEAASAGCALVLSDLPSLRELWSDAAGFADAQDVRALHDALERLIASPARQKVLRQAARRRAKAFRPQAMGSAYRNLYQHLQLDHPLVAEQTDRLITGEHLQV